MAQRVLITGGSGFVGATVGYALVMQGVGREIVLVDRNTARAAAEADDIRHAVPFAHPLDVRAGARIADFGTEAERDRAAAVEALDRRVHHRTIGAEAALEHVALQDAEKLQSAIRRFYDGRCRLRRGSGGRGRLTRQVQVRHRFRRQLAVKQQVEETAECEKNSMQIGYSKKIRPDCAASDQLRRSGRLTCRRPLATSHRRDPEWRTA